MRLRKSIVTNPGDDFFRLRRILVCCWNAFPVWIVVQNPSVDFLAFNGFPTGPEGAEASYQLIEDASKAKPVHSERVSLVSKNELDKEINPSSG